MFHLQLVWLNLVFGHQFLLANYEITRSFFDRNFPRLIREQCGTNARMNEKQEKRERRRNNTKKSEKVEDDATERGIFAGFNYTDVWRSPGARNIYQPVCTSKEIKFSARHRRNRASRCAATCQLLYLSLPLRSSHAPLLFRFFHR